MRFPELLRTSGMNVTTRNILQYVRALEALGVTERKSVYWAGRATLVQREGSPANIAQAVLYLMDNDFVTGSCLPVDGGRSIFAGGN